MRSFRITQPSPRVRLGALAALTLILIVQAATSATGPRGIAGRLMRTLVEQGVPCSNPQYWSTPPKGEAAVSCGELQIHSFKRTAGVKELVDWRLAPARTRVLRDHGLRLWLVNGRQWVVLTPSSRIASKVTRVLGGRLRTVAFSHKSRRRLAGRPTATTSIGSIFVLKNLRTSSS